MSKEPDDPANSYGAESNESLADLALPSFEARFPGEDFIGDVASYPELNRVFGEAQRRVAENGNPWPGILRRVSDELRPAIQKLGPHSGESSSLRFALTGSAAVTSRYMPYSDGSGIVLLNVGVLSMAEMLSRPVAELVASTFESTNAWEFIKKIRRIHKGRGSDLSEYGLAVNSSLIRYNLINRMLLDNSGSLHYELTPAGDRVQDIIRHQCITFVVAHEIAHHLLGHGKRMRGFSPDDDLRQCRDDHDIEFQADTLAIRLLLSLQPNGHLPGLGALLSFAAVTLAETALYVRPGLTHPDAGDRMGRVLDILPRLAASGLASVSGQLIAIMERSSDFTQELTASFWKTLMECHQVLTEPHGESQFRKMHKLDQILCHSDEENLEALRRTDQEEGTAVLSALEELRGADQAVGLAMLGVSAKASAEIADPDRVLTFARLRKSIDDGLSADSRLGREHRRIVSIAITRLAKPVLARRL